MIHFKTEFDNDPGYLILRILILIVSICALLTLPCNASGTELPNLAGRSVEIKNRDLEKVLVVDGREMHTTQYISIDDIFVIDGTLVALGSSSPGGNACDSSPFVISFPVGKLPRFDGPLENCASVFHTVENNQLMFSTGNIPGSDTDRWKWTAEAGFSPLGSVPFKPDAFTGWNNLRERAFSHPSDAFKNSEISNALRVVLKDDFENFQKLMSGVGESEYKEDDFVGTSCKPHACMDEAGLIFLSANSRRAFAAWKPEGGKIVVYPAPVKDWPEKARVELRQWARQWRD